MPSNTVNSACNQIYKSWARFVPQHEARLQADEFRRRFKTLAAEGHLTEAELDATLSIVAEAMR